MKKASFILLLLGCTIVVFSQEKIDSALYKKLGEMYKADQKWRVESNKLYNHQKSNYYEVTIEKYWADADKQNQQEAKRIITKYGYPGYSLVGETGSHRFWAIVQHCDNDVSFQQKVLQLMKKQVDRKNASGENYAYLTDRVLINTNQKQLYGTQGTLEPKTKKWTPLPITDPKHVEARRKAMGMQSLVQYAAEINSGN